VIRGSILSANPKTEDEALRVKISTALSVIIVILLILLLMHKNQLLSGVAYNGQTTIGSGVIAPLPSVKKIQSSPAIVLVSPSNLGTPAGPY
jgi:hypothetical protein